jgi:hypothetical protein
MLKPADMHDLKAGNIRADLVCQLGLDEEEQLRAVVCAEEVIKEMAQMGPPPLQMQTDERAYDVHVVCGDLHPCKLRKKDLFEDLTGKLTWTTTLQDLRHAHDKSTSPQEWLASFSYAAIVAANAAHVDAASSLGLLPAEAAEEMHERFMNAHAAPKGWMRFPAARLLYAREEDHHGLPR